MGWASLRVRQSASPERSNALALYYTQLAVNFVWPLLFFRVGLYGTAFWWLILLLALVLVTARAFYRIDRQAGWLLVPYLAWLIYAAYLNAGVMNAVRSLRWQNVTIASLPILDESTMP